MTFHCALFKLGNVRVTDVEIKSLFGWFLRLRDLEPVLFRLIPSTKLFHILYLTWLHTQPCVRLSNSTHSKFVNSSETSQDE